MLGWLTGLSTASCIIVVVIDGIPYGQWGDWMVLECADVRTYTVAICLGEVIFVFHV